MQLSAVRHWSSVEIMEAPSELSISSWARTIGALYPILCWNQPGPIQSAMQFVPFFSRCDTS